MEARIKKQNEEIKHLKVDKTDFFIFLNNLVNSTESGCYWFNAWRISDEVPCQVKCKQKSYNSTFLFRHKFEGLSVAEAGLASRWMEKQKRAEKDVPDN